LTKPIGIFIAAARRCLALFGNYLSVPNVVRFRGLGQKSMLVVTKKPGDTIHLGPDVTITIVGIKGNKVRIGIDAPEKTSVVRDPDLIRVLEAWPALSDPIRRALLALIGP
jgi:carbon storage regulator CsrA